MSYNRKTACELAGLSVIAFKNLERRNQLPWQDPENPNAVEGEEAQDGWTQYSAEQVIQLAVAAELSNTMPLTVASGLAGLMPIKTCIGESRGGQVDYFAATARYRDNDGAGDFVGLTGNFSELGAQLLKPGRTITLVQVCNVGDVIRQVVFRAARAGIVFNPASIG